MKNIAFDNLMLACFVEIKTDNFSLLEKFK